MPLVLKRHEGQLTDIEGNKVAVIRRDVFVRPAPGWQVIYADGFVKLHNNVDTVRLWVDPDNPQIKLCIVAPRHINVCREEAINKMPRSYQRKTRFMGRRPS